MPFFATKKCTQLHQCYSEEDPSHSSWGFFGLLDPSALVNHQCHASCVCCRSSMIIVVETAASKFPWSSSKKQCQWCPLATKWCPKGSHTPRGVVDWWRLSLDFLDNYCHVGYWKNMAVWYFLVIYVFFVRLSWNLKDYLYLFIPWFLRSWRLHFMGIVDYHELVG